MLSALHSAFSCRKRVPFPKPRNAFSPSLSLSLLNCSLARPVSRAKWDPFGGIFHTKQYYGRLPDVTSDQLSSSLCKERASNSEASGKAGSPISFSVLSRQRPHRGVSWTRDRERKREKEAREKRSRSLASVAAKQFVRSFLPKPKPLPDHRNEHISRVHGIEDEGEEEEDGFRLVDR